MTTNHQTQGRWSRFSESTRLRVLALLLLLTTSAVIALGYLGMRGVTFVGDRAQVISGEKLEAQLAQHLRQVNAAEVKQAELQLRRVELDVQALAFYSARLLAAESGSEASGYWSPEEKMFFGPEGQYVNSGDELSSVYLPNFVEIDANVMAELRRTAYLDPLFAAMQRSSPVLKALFIGTERDLLRYYPNINLGETIPPDLKVRQRPWYVAATPSENHTHAVQWTAVYTDVTGKGLLATASAPVYLGGDEFVEGDKFVGVAGLELSLAQIGEDLVASNSKSDYTLLLDERGQPIVLSKQGYQDILGRVPAADEARVDLRTTETAFAPLLKEMVAGEAGQTTVRVSEQDFLVAYAPLENSTGWSLAHLLEAQSLETRGILQTELRALVREVILFRVLPIAAGTLLFISVVGYLAINRLTAPLEAVVGVVQEFEQGNWETSLPETRSTEINRLAQTLDTMRAYIQEMVNTLEDQVAARTAELEQRTMQFQAVAELSQLLARSQAIQDMLDTAVDFIAGRFDIYHVGIFLPDDTGTWMLLRAASSAGGHRLLVAGHKLKIGGRSIIGYVSSTARSRIALDVGMDAVYFDNPELPETRSELALPLMAHGELVGALDLQSREKQAFSEADVEVLRILANGLAISIEKTQIQIDIGKTVEHLRRYQEQEALSGWYRILARRQREIAYTYDRVTVEEGAPGAQSLLPFVQGELTEVQVQQVDGQYFLLAPIRMQQQTLGVLTFTAT
ncbi:MAG: GAF domain-containing protein, partial [Chloroflexota bacterium]|nr:GAF domain-containing protein [Chloroflexota bacterium]